LHLTEKTFVFFTSDNGGTREYIAPLRGGKGTLYEGGLRVPAVVSGPGIPSSKSCDAKMLTMDFYPTILEMAGLPRPHGQTLDGTNLLPLALGKTDAPTRDLFWHFPSYSGPTSPASAIHSGDWKLIEFFETGKPELYNLAQDPFESIDLAAKEPDKARYLLAKLKSWQSELRAPCPSSPNPNYDPKALRKQKRDASDKGTRKFHPGKTSPDSPQ
jgi:arylsulfatase A-like enzyme